MFGVRHTAACRGGRGGRQRTQFRGIETVRVIKKEVPRNQFTKNEAAAAADLALKAHVIAFDPKILAEMTDGDAVMKQIADTVNLTEAPEDAVCSLVIDLMQYCEREKINWSEDVMERAQECLRGEHVHENQKP
jgi:hypothetical protein